MKYLETVYDKLYTRFLLINVRVHVPFPHEKCAIIGNPTVNLKPQNRVAENAASSKETIPQISFLKVIPGSKNCGPTNPLSASS